MTQHQAKTLDLRPLLGTGEEHFAAIMDAKEQLMPGQALHLIAPFLPLPLYEIFQTEGFNVRSKHISDEEWHIFFERSDSFDT